MGTDVDYMRTLFMLREGHAPWEYEFMCWYLRSPANEGRGPDHEVEKVYARDLNVSNGRYFWHNEENALRYYCQFYKIGPYTQGGNDERHDSLATAAS